VLNQSDPAGLGRTLAYYGYFAQQRTGKIYAIEAQVQRLQQLVAEIDRQTEQLQTLESDAKREMAGIEHARAERADALRASRSRYAAPIKSSQIGSARAGRESLDGDSAGVAGLRPSMPAISRFRIALQGLKLFCLPIDFRDQLLQPLHLSFDGVNFTGALLREVSVVRKGAAETGRIALVQQQLELLLPADHIGRPHLGRQGGALSLQRTCVAACWARSSARAALRRFARMQRIQRRRFAVMTSSDSRQARAQCVPFLRSSPRRLVSAAMRARTAASLTFACTESAGSAAPPQAPAQYRTADATATQNCLRRRLAGGAHAQGWQHTRLCPLLYLAARNTHCASRMQRLFEFITHHPYLATGAILAAAVLAFMRFATHTGLRR